MGKSRRTRKKDISQINPRVVQELGIDSTQEVTPLTTALAAFREAVEFQQYMSEILNHAEQTKIQVPDENEVHKASQSMLPEIAELYYQSRLRVVELGMEAAELMDPEREENLIVVPEVSLA